MDLCISQVQISNFDWLTNLKSGKIDFVILLNLSLYL